MSAHHRLIRALVAEVRTLREAAANAEDFDGSYNDYLAERQAEQAARLERRRQDELRDARNRAEDYENAVRQLDRARQAGNDYEVERALRTLKSL